MSLNPGVRLGSRYEILASLGAGGMGEVYRARDLRLGRDVAVKVLPEHLSQNPQSLARFEREAKAVAALSHPNILTIHDFCTDGISFAVMELLQGQTLRSLLSNSKIPANQALEIAVAIADGLAAAHSAGVIHRDLKPENIFITEDKTVKILDFGLARLERSASPSDASYVETQSRTEHGVVLGTLPYMSPEQVKGDSLDARSDIFSFGALFYELLTTRRAFDRRTHAETIAAILSDNPSLPDEKQFVPQLNFIVKHCLEKDREQRFQTAREVVSALKSVASHSIPITQFTPKSRSAFRPSHWIASLLTLLLISAGIYLFYPRSKPITSIAVLPFSNAGTDEETRFFSDGITDNVINTLSQLPDLRVMARTTVFTFKEKQIDPRKAGADLNVGAVLTGKVIRHGTRLIIQAELVEVATGLQLWGSKYNEDKTEIFEVQDEISRQISQSLHLKLTGKQKQLLQKHYTENTEAYQLYQQGRFYWYKDTYEGYEKSRHYFGEAIEQDHNYALAYSGLSDAYSALAVQGFSRPKEVFPKSEEAAIQALKIDEELGEAHASMGLIRKWYYWDWKGAEDQFRRAISLSPNYAEAHHYLSVHLRNMGRFDEAMTEMRRAHQLDPLSLATNTNLGSVYYWTRRYDEAIAQYRKTLEMDPNWTRARDELADAYAQKKMFKEAIQEQQKYLRLLGDNDGAEILLKDFENHGYAEAKKRQYQRVLELYQEAEKEQYVSPIVFAILYAQINENDKAFLWLEKAYQERSPWLATIRSDPQFDKLRSDPRFTELMRKVGLPL